MGIPVIKAKQRKHYIHKPTPYGQENLNNNKNVTYALVISSDDWIKSRRRWL